MELTQKQIDKVVDELEFIDEEVLYREFLENNYGEVEICGMTYDQATIFEELDPTAFNVGCSDYISSLEDDGELVMIEGSYYFASEVDDLVDSMEDEEEDE